MGNRLLFARSPEWASAIGRAATLTAQPDFRLLKATARTRAGFLVCVGVEVFVKRVDTGSRVSLTACAVHAPAGRCEAPLFWKPPDSRIPSRLPRLRRAQWVRCARVMY